MLSRKLFALLLVAVVLRTVFAELPNYNSTTEANATDVGDEKRFLLQAKFLREGQGYVTHHGQELCTYVPPGYPVFVAGVTSIRDSVALLTACQLLLSLLSVSLLYFAILPDNPRLAFFAAFVLAASPWQARAAWLTMSESLGVFLTTLLMWLVSRFERDRAGRLDGLLFGAVAVAACLTVPAVSVVAAGVWAIVSVKNLRKPALVAGCVVGAMAVMTPWQMHCFKATGAIVPTLLTELPRDYHGTVDWLRTWVRSPDEFKYGMGLFVHPVPDPDYSLLPASAIGSTRELDELVGMVNTWRATGALRADASPEYRRLDERMAAIAAERRGAAPIRCSVMLPIQRGWNLWTDMPQIGLASRESLRRLWPQAVQEEFTTHGWKRGGLRIGRAAWSGLMCIAYWAILVLVWGIGLSALRSRAAIPWAVILGTLVYTAICGVSIYAESRRNLPFEAMILYLAAYVPASVTAQLASLGDRVLRLIRRRPATPTVPACH